MATKLDLHVHSLGSDGSGTPMEFVEAIQRAGLDGIVLTDHHKTLTAEGKKVLEAISAAGLVAITGCEYSTKDGHCLVYGVDVDTLGFGFYPEMQDVIDRVWEAGGVAFPSHPFRGVKETLGFKVYGLERLTALEAYNGQNEAGNGYSKEARPEANQKAVLAANRMGLALAGGSDAHAPHRIGTCYTVFSREVRSEADLVAALRARDHTAAVNQGMVEEQKKARQFYQDTQSASHPSTQTQLDWSWAHREAKPYKPHRPRNTSSKTYAHPEPSDHEWRETLARIDRLEEEEVFKDQHLDTPDEPDYSEPDTYGEEDLPWELEPEEERLLEQLRDEDIPDSAFQEDFVSEAPEDVQEFLLHSTGKKWSKHRRHNRSR